MTYKEKYSYWKQNVKDEDLLKELDSLNEEQIEDSFYKDLSFGTGGLRGVLGAGSNRLNIYTVAKATKGLSEYLKKHYPDPSVAIGYDTRINSDLFSKTAAEVLAQNGIRVHIYKEPLPVPTLSYAVRALNCCAGIMITASHNPAIYNGYKVYGSDGCQITTDAAKEIYDEIRKVDEFEVEKADFENHDLISYIDESVLDRFIEEVKAQSFLYDEKIDKDISVVYSPLNGTGMKPVTRVLKELGYSNVIIVKEQEKPDGHFPTCPYPNPEVRQAMDLGIEYARKNDADILIATDPDCDRVGVAVKDGDDFTILNGNQVGVLLLNYICERKTNRGDMPEDPVLIKTIVTTDMADRIADHYKAKTINVLTGYKFIGEQIGLLEKDGRDKDFIFSFEESDGYLSGTYVRDKDGVNGACLICEMYCYYRSKGVSLLQKLEELYKKYGFYVNTLKSYEFPGASGFEKMQKIMKTLREEPLRVINNNKIIDCKDYLEGIDRLPKSDVIKIFLEDCSSLVIRPSGTEPKLKVYISTISDSFEDSRMKNDAIADYVDQYLKRQLD